MAWGGQGDKPKKVKWEMLTDKPKKSKLKWEILAIAIIIVIIIIVGSIPITTNIISKGTVVNVAAGECHIVEIKVPKKLSVNLKASFDSSNGITAYIVTLKQFSEDIESNSWNYYTYTSGHLIDGSVSGNINNGTWEVVFYNSNIITSTTLTINSLTTTYDLYQCFPGNN